MTQCRIHSLLLALLFAASVVAGSEACGQTKWSQERFEQRLRQSQIRPQWLPGKAAFYYTRNESAGQRTYVRINAETGEKKNSSDPKELDLPVNQEVLTSSLKPTRSSASTRTGAPCVLQFVNRMTVEVTLFWVNPDAEPVRYASVAPGESHRQPTYEGHLWRIQDPQGEQIAALTATTEHTQIIIDRKSNPTEVTRGKNSNRRAEGHSPDGHWRAVADGDKISLHGSKEDDVQHLTAQISGGSRFHGTVVWSPNSDAFVISAAVPVTTRQVTLVRSSPRDQLQPNLITFDYAKPGDPLPLPVPVLFRLVEGTFQSVVIESELFPRQYCDSPSHRYTWSDDGREFYFDFNERGHQRYQILAVDRQTAKMRSVVEETSHTFIDYTNKTWRHWLPDKQELLWLSERTGWCHLWKIDASGQQPPLQMTSGDWVVREVLQVDPAAQTVWFTAGGLQKDEDPYHLQLCRVQFDGTDFHRLTSEDGFHEIQFSPDFQYFLDTWSRVDQAPVTDLRRSNDGTLVTRVEEQNTTDFVNIGYQPVERFSAKGRNGQTDIYGVIVKPSHFDPEKRYPVVERVYAGPHGTFTPKKFGSHTQLQTIAELGFIVVQADGMGTNHRGKAFHDVCWKNLKDAGFPDRIAWMKAAATTRPWMDLSRVGIFGGSAGGQTAMRALLDHADFYQVAVADCGCHDNRMDKIWWNEQWMGWPIDDSYARNSNVDDAHKIQGKLLLIVGELDRNVDPASTLQVVGALQKAGKSFDFAPIINAGHGAAETPAGMELRRQFLIRHLRPTSPQ